MGFRQIFGGCTPPKYFTAGVPSNIWGGYNPKKISRMGFRQIFGGCTPPKYLTDGVPSNIWRVYTPKIFDGWGSVKYLGAVDPQNISKMRFCHIFGGSRPPKYLTDGVLSKIRGLYTPKKFDGWDSVKNLGGLHPKNISRMGFRQIFGGSTAPKYFTDGVPSNIWGVYTPKIFDGWGSVKYLGPIDPQNISRMGFRQIFGGSTPPTYLTDVCPSNI